MIAFANEVSNRRGVNQIAGIDSAYGTYFGLQQKQKDVRCFVEIAGTMLPIDVPALLLQRHRQHADAQIRFRVGGEPPVSMRDRTAEEHADLRGWMAEMEDLDRF